MEQQQLASNIQLDEQQIIVIKDLLQNLQNPNNQKQQELYQKTEQLKENPEFFMYLAYIMSNQQFSSELRIYAIVTLQGGISRHHTKIVDSPQVFNYVKQQILATFNDPLTIICTKIGNIVTALIQKAGFERWTDILDFLHNNLMQNNEHLVFVTISCLGKIIEDLSQNYENHGQFAEKLDQLIPKLLEFCQGSFKPEIRSKALEALNNAIYMMPKSLEQNLPIYINTLVEILYDQSVEVRLKGVQGIQAILESSYSYHFEGKMDEIVKRISERTGDEDYNVAKNACYFWVEYVSEYEDEEELRVKLKIIGKHLNTLIPAIIKGLRFTEEDLMNQLPDGINYTGKPSETGVVGDGETIDGFVPADPEDQKEIYDEGETLRRNCGGLIQKFSRHYRDEVFLVAKPIISSLFEAKNWVDQEMGILALGGLAEGSLEAISQDLPTIFPVLLQKMMNTNEGQLMSTTLWTLSKFTSYVVEIANSNSELVKSYLQTIVKGMQCNDKKVYDSSCHALSVLIDEGSFILEPFILDILQVFINAINVQNIAQQDMLYEALQCFVKEMQEKLKQKETADMLLGALTNRFKSFNPEDIQICSLVECLAYVSDILEDFFGPYCKDCFDQCAIMMKNYLYGQDKHTEYNRKEICLRSVDLMSSIVMVSNKDFINLCQNIDFQNWLELFLDNDYVEIKQFMVSLIAEIGKHCPQLLQPKLSIFISKIAQFVEFYPEELDPEGQSGALCNNAVWCLVEIFTSFFGQDNEGILKQFIVQLAEKLVQFINSQEKIEKTVARNFSKALGKLGFLCPQEISPMLGMFLKQFCLSLRAQTQDTTYAKGEAFKGLFAMIQNNPQAAIPNFQYVIECFGNYKQAKQDLKEQFRQILVDFKGTMNEQAWEEYLANPQYFAPAFRKKIATEYQL